MNTRIFSLVMENLQHTFSLPKYADLQIDKQSIIDDLPFTPARKEKFCQSIMNELDIDRAVGGIWGEVNDLNEAVGGAVGGGRTKVGGSIKLQHEGATGGVMHLALFEFFIFFCT